MLYAYSMDPTNDTRDHRSLRPQQLAEGSVGGGSMKHSSSMMTHHHRCLSIVIKAKIRYDSTLFLVLITLLGYKLLPIYLL